MPWHLDLTEWDDLVTHVAASSFFAEKDRVASDLVAYDLAASLCHGL